MLFFNPHFWSKFKTLMVTNAGDNAGKYKLVEIEAYLRNRLCLVLLRLSNTHYWLLIRISCFGIYLRYTCIYTPEASIYLVQQIVRKPILGKCYKTKQNCDSLKLKGNYLNL